MQKSDTLSENKEAFPRKIKQKNSYTKWKIQNHNIVKWEYFLNRLQIQHDSD